MSEKSQKEEKLKIQEEKLEVVKKFTEKIRDKYGELLKSVVMFGEHIPEKSEDIDVFVVLDDTIEAISSEESEKINKDFQKIAESISSQLSIQPLYSLTTYWGYVRTCHPVMYNFIKTGIPVYDTGFFAPIKRLLDLGKIPFTREQIEMFMEDAPKKLMRAETVKLLMLTEDCYYAILNTAQAVLMLKGIPPPPPTRAYEVVKESLVEPGLLEPEYAEWLKAIVQVRKSIEKREIMKTKGAYVDEWIDKSNKFVERMRKLFSTLEKTQKQSI